MTQPKPYVPAEIKIVCYKRHSGRVRKLYTAGTQARVTTADAGMVGVKNRKIVPLEDPDSIPYIIVGISNSRNSSNNYYALSEDNYYDVLPYWDSVSKKTAWKIHPLRKKKNLTLTTLHQTVAKRVLSDYLKAKLNETISI